jgi:hypothetical protein
MNAYLKEIADLSGNIKLTTMLPDIPLQQL